MIITTDDDIFGFYVEGDCCSVSWFADIIGVEKVQGTRIKEIREPDLSNYNTDDGRCRQESESVYGYDLVSEDGGICTIVFRNSSNGYYGGWMSSGGGTNLDGLNRVVDNWTNIPNQY